MKRLQVLVMVLVLFVGSPLVLLSEDVTDVMIREIRIALANAELVSLDFELQGIIKRFEGSIKDYDLLNQKIAEVMGKNDKITCQDLPGLNPGMILVDVQKKTIRIIEILERA